MATISQSIDGKHFQNYAEHATSKKCSFHHSDSHKMSLPLASITQTQSCSSNPNTRAITLLKLNLYVFSCNQIAFADGKCHRLSIYSNLQWVEQACLLLPMSDSDSAMEAIAICICIVICICICICNCICICIWQWDEQSCLLSPTSDSDSAREAIVFEENHIELDKTAAFIVIWKRGKLCKYKFQLCKYKFKLCKYKYKLYKYKYNLQQIEEEGIWSRTNKERRENWRWFEGWEINCTSTNTNCTDKKINTDCTNTNTNCSDTNTSTNCTNTNSV